MAEKRKQTQASIIAVIQEMVKSGESEEKIIKSLRELGIEPDKAKRLLLLGQADTFALLQNEIGKIVRSYVEDEKPKLVEFIKEEAERGSQEMTKKIEERTLNAFRDDQRFIENQATMFQARINQSVKNILQLNEDTKRNLAELGGRLANTEREVWNLKHRIVGSKTRKGISAVLIGLQLLRVVVSASLLITSFPGFTPQTLLLSLVIGALLITMVYLVMTGG